MATKKITGKSFGTFYSVKKGDLVTRSCLGNALRIRLRVTNITAGEIICGDFVFDRRTGCQIDAASEWGPPPLKCECFLVDARHVV